MEDYPILELATVVTILFFWNYQKNKKRFDYIKQYKFNRNLIKRVQQKFPDLKDEEITAIFRGLKDYFYICNKANGKMVAMPSYAVDIAWHEFILFTREYKKFTTNAMGKFLHHTPTEAMKTPKLAQKSIKLAWKLSCQKEKIDPLNPKKIPHLFEIDKKLNIENGIIYTLDKFSKQDTGKNSINNIEYCVYDIGCNGDSSSSSGSNCSGSSCSSCGGGGD